MSMVLLVMFLVLLSIQLRQQPYLTTIQHNLKTDIPKLKVHESVVINLNGSSHWVALIRLPDGYFYMDSFGVIAPRILDNLTYIYSEVDLQSLCSSACGFYCLAFLLSMNRGGKGEEMYRQFIDAFKGKEANDVTLKRRFGF